ncbi:MAG: tRNA lysidine(34) synthetase TilS [Alphaproteobacteria bacterium]|nr:tRNA lysidine(34) synthetase TilS [Alphaproteobacteria bacterium]
MISFADRMTALGEDIPSLAVAVSGGADSIALALLAKEWADARSIPLVAFTVDHALRPDSADEAAQVAAWLSKRGITHRILRWEHREAPSANIQAAARCARYRVLAEACAEAGIRHLLLAHHQDDQAETFLIRLHRGSGVDGLAAMRPVSQQGALTVLRPLLDMPKTALIAYLEAQNQPWVEDPSNQNLRHTRVKMRQALPALEAATGITAQHFAATSARMARASDYLRQQTALARESCLTLHDEGYITLHLPEYQLLHPEIALRVLADVFRLMNHDAYRPRFSELEALHASLPEARTLGGCQFIPKHGKMLVVRELAHIAPAQALPVNTPTLWDGRFMVTALSEGLSIRHAATELPEGAEGLKAVLHACPAIHGLENAVYHPHMQVKGAAMMDFPFIIRPFPMRDSGWL